ncbi:MAG TPA: hypothetical protein VKA46_31850 [Gemmataceae bacterium]|nr:hypothetical protein [Gemmataceae bacterium]
MGERILIGTRKGLFTVERAGGGWAVTRSAFFGDNVSMALSDRRDGRTYAALDHGHFGVKMHRSADGGRTWEECGTPAYPPKPDGPDEPNGMGQVVPWKLHRVWALEGGLDDQPGLLWCGTIPGGLFVSRDRASSWELVRPLWDHPKRKEWFGGGADWPGIHSVCVDPRDGRRVLVGVSCGGTWVTEDAGQTFSCRAEGMWAAYMPPERRNDPNIQDPHRVVRCPAAPVYLWAQHHNGVFRTTNGAASWEEVTGLRPSSFGFAVAVHPRDPETAWFVPAIKDEKRIPVGGRFVVTRTRDGGRTCEVLSRGLPTGDAYDIVYRHALDVDDTGDTLALGSTTGSLWVSDDGGDSWQAVSNHLPPIYCVRFAA